MSNSIGGNKSIAPTRSKVLSELEDPLSKSVLFNSDYIPTKRVENLTIKKEDEIRIVASLYNAARKQTTGSIYSIVVDIGSSGTLNIGVKDFKENILAVSMLKRENNCPGAGELAGIRLGDILFGINFIPTREGSKTLKNILKGEIDKGKSYVHIQGWRCHKLCPDPISGYQFPRADEVIVQAYSLYRNKVFSDWERWNFIEILLGHMIEDLKMRANDDNDVDESGQRISSHGILRAKQLQVLDLERNIMQAKGLRSALCVRIVQTKSQSEAVIYVLRIEDIESGLQWIVNKRYSDFHALNEELLDMSHFAKELEFPGKRLSLGRQGVAKLVESRIVALEQYMRKVLHLLSIYATMDHSASKSLRHVQKFLGVDFYLDCVHPPVLDDQRHIELMTYRFLNDFSSPACQQCIRFISNVDLDAVVNPSVEDGYQPVLNLVRDALSEVEQFVQQEHQQQMMKILHLRRPEFTAEQLNTFVRKCIRRQVEAALFLPLRRTLFRILYTILNKKSKKMQVSITLLQKASPNFLMIDPFVLKAKSYPDTVQAFRRVIQAYLPADQGQLLIQAANAVSILHKECQEEKIRLKNNLHTPSNHHPIIDNNNHNNHNSSSSSNKTSNNQESIVNEEITLTTPITSSSIANTIHTSNKTLSNQEMDIIDKAILNNIDMNKTSTLFIDIDSNIPANNNSVLPSESSSSTTRSSLSKKLSPSKILQIFNTQNKSLNEQLFTDSESDNESCLTEINNNHNKNHNSLNKQNLEQNNIDSTITTITTTTTTIHNKNNHKAKNKLNFLRKSSHNIDSPIFIDETEIAFAVTMQDTMAGSSLPDFNSPTGSANKESDSVKNITITPSCRVINHSNNNTTTTSQARNNSIVRDEDLSSIESLKLKNISLSASKQIHNISLYDLESDDAYDDDVSNDNINNNNINNITTNTSTATTTATTNSNENSCNNLDNHTQQNEDIEISEEPCHIKSMKALLSIDATTIDTTTTTTTTTMISHEDVHLLHNSIKNIQPSNSSSNSSGININHNISQIKSQVYNSHKKLSSKDALLIHNEESFDEDEDMLLNDIEERGNSILLNNTSEKNNVVKLEAISADDFLPLFTFSLVQAGLPQLLLVKELMITLVSDEDSYGECGYYLATLEAATQHICDLAEQFEQYNMMAQFRHEITPISSNNNMNNMKKN